MQKQFTVKEVNDSEGETFNYILLITDELAKIISEKAEELGEDSLTISETNYTDEDIIKMNKASNNTYMDFIAPYRLNETSLDNWEEFGDCFYKGVGLTKLKELPKPSMFIDDYKGEKETKIMWDRTREVIYNGVELLMNTYSCSTCEKTYHFECIKHNFCPFCGTKYKFEANVSV